MKAGNNAEGKQIWGVGSLLYYTYGIIANWEVKVKRWEKSITYSVFRGAECDS